MALPNPSQMSKFSTNPTKHSLRIHQTSSHRRSRALNLASKSWKLISVLNNPESFNDRFGSNNPTSQDYHAGSPVEGGSGGISIQIFACSIPVFGGGDPAIYAAARFRFFHVNLCGLLKRNKRRSSTPPPPRGLCPDTFSDGCSCWTFCRGCAKIVGNLQRFSSVEVGFFVTLGSTPPQRLRSFYDTWQTFYGGDHRQIINSFARSINRPWSNQQQPQFRGADPRNKLPY